MVKTIPYQHLLGLKVVIYQYVYIFAIDGSKHEGWGAAHVASCVFVSSYALMARDPEECNFCVVLFAYLCISRMVGSRYSGLFIASREERLSVQTTNFPL